MSEDQSVVRNLSYELVFAIRALLSEDSDQAPGSGPYVKIRLNFNAENTSTQRGKVRFYCPELFGKLRKAFGIASDAEFLKSWSLDSTAGATKSAGKSGSAFVRSSDGRFFIKTLIKEEKDTCLRILPAYLKYLKKNKDSTLLNWILAFGRLRVDGENVYFCVLNNLFQGFSGKPDELYDLKGSEVNRKTKESKLAANPSMVRMDLDLTRSFSISADSLDSLKASIHQDAQFLASQNIMDHSLIVGVFKIQESETKTKKKKKSKKRKQQEEDVEIVDNDSKGDASPSPSAGAVEGRRVLSSKDGTENFVVGIIDILQDYNLKKKLAHVCKSVLHDSDKLSTVNADLYGKRFEKFTSSVFNSS